MYKLFDNGMVIKNQETYIPFDISNQDYQEYLRWLDEGNIPEPADPPPVYPPPGPTNEERLEAAEQLIDMLLEGTDG